LTQADAMRIAAPSPPPVLAVPRLPGSIEISRLDNGLTVCLHKNPQAPVVTTALWYRVGTRDETLAHGGVAHFLEHLMFKGSARFGPGEIDRRTQALGGSNNAFTSHDATAYYFNFAADRWRQALEIEADRMAGLRLEPDEVASERQVILEEIAMYEDDPQDTVFDVLGEAVFGAHPLGRPIIGRAPVIRDTPIDVIAEFHARRYVPGSVVIAAAGSVDHDAIVELATRTLGERSVLEPVAPPCASCARTPSRSTSRSAASASSAATTAASPPACWTPSSAGCPPRGCSRPCARSAAWRTRSTRSRASTPTRARSACTSARGRTTSSRR
jgi:predicted Zn-dependent peptidase